MRSPRVLVPAMIFFLAIGGCRAKPTPTPEVAPTEPVVAGPRLTNLAPVVQFRQRETDEPHALEPDEEVIAQPGANVLIGENGRALLEWPGFLANDLLSGADTLLSLSEPDLRHVMLDQASGTARYVLEGPGEPADLQVTAAWIEIRVSEGEADFIVSFIPGADPSVWLAVLAGEAEITRGEDVVTLASGQAVGHTEKGPAREPFEVDATAVSAWYDDLASGEAEGSIATVALRCAVQAEETDFLAAPDSDADEAGDALPQGTVVNVLQRDESGEWLLVTPLAATRGGWVVTEDLTCNGPVAGSPTEGVVEEAEVPTATATRRPRVTFTPSATFGVVTMTPTATTTPSGAWKINFWADDDKIDLGDCTDLHWETENIREVYYQGRGVVGNATREECPKKDTTYELKVILLDGTEEKRRVTVEVRGAGETPEVTNTPKPAEPKATDTPFVIPSTDTPQPPAPTDTEPPPAPTDTEQPPPQPTDTEQPPPQPTDTEQPPPQPTDTPTL